MAAAFDFDTPPTPDHPHSLRWQRYRGRDVIPLWVADMDFAAPPAVVDAVRAWSEDPVYGYPALPAGLAAAVAAYSARRYAWAVDPESIVWLPGLVSGLNLAVRAFAGPAEAVVVMPPIYPPFLGAPGLQGAVALPVPLRAEGMHYRMDIDGLRKALAGAASHPRLLMLCHPHNPVGRAWSRGELEALAAVVAEFDLLVCSDEVHCDLLLGDLPHIPFASLPGMAARCVTLMAPSKTYNVAGLGVAWAVIGDPSLRARFRKAMQGLVPQVGGIGFAALAACVDGSCEDWRQALLDYLRGNRDLVVRRLMAMGYPVAPVEATFLAWLDARSLADAHRRVEAAGVGLSDGVDFGAPGFLRLNFGTQRSLLAAALDRIEHVGATAR